MNMRKPMMKTTRVAALLGLSLLVSSSWAATELGSKEWYARLTVSNAEEGLNDSRNLLGQLDDSVAGYDVHDLIELSPFAEPYLTLVFPHEAWEKKPGNYATDFRSSGVKRENWMFEVRSDSTERDITLRWDLTSNKNPGTMWLVDAATGEVIRSNGKGKARAVSAYSFNMDGQSSRTFYWVLGSKATGL